MYAQKRHWLDYDPVAVAVLVIGLAMIELLAMIIGVESSAESGHAPGEVGNDTQLALSPR